MGPHDNAKERSGNRREATATLPNKAGLHARSAAMLVKAAARYQCTVTLACNGRTANARSLMDLLRLGARQGHDLTIRAEGPDADVALRDVTELIERGFDEE